MMGNFLELLGQWIEFLWPLKTVQEWERGVEYVFGHYWRTVDPGVYVVIPFFMKMIEVSIVPGIHWTPLQTVTLADGRQLTYSLSITAEVVDAAAALNNVERHSETLMEFVASMIAEELSIVDPTRFDPKYGKRDRLMDYFTSRADEQAQKWGVRVSAIRFTNFAVGLRTYRLLTAAPALTV